MKCTQLIRAGWNRTSRTALVLLAATTFAVSGCDKGDKDKGAAATTGGGDKPLIIGFIYVGEKQDYGYNQAHAEGAAAVKNIPGVKVLEQENVKEDDSVTKAMESMIEEGSKVVFPTSYGFFKPFVLDLAPKHKDVTFLHCGGTYVEGKTPENVGTYFGYIDECEYLSGIVAAKSTKTRKLGFIAAKPIPQVLRNINAFELGAKSVDPSITTTVVFTLNWFEPIKEANAANSLIEQGIDVLTCHVDSPKAILKTAEGRGVMVCGYHSNGAAIAPKGYLTGAEWNWAKPYTDYVNAIKAGKKWDHTVRGGLKDGFVKMSAYGPAVSDDAKKACEDAKAKFMTGTFVIFKGPMKDNAGADLYKDGETHIQTDPALEGMGYLVEGVMGSVPK